MRCVCLVCLKKLVIFLFLDYSRSIFGFCFFSVRFLVLCVCAFSFVMILSRKLKLCATDFIVFHSVCCLSVVNGKDCILVIWYRYAATLCLVGWLDMKLMGVFVVAGFLYISVSRLEGFLIIKRLRTNVSIVFVCWV